jgi:hypothetical protein
VSGTWVFALLQQSEQIEKGRSGELCADEGRLARQEVRGLDRNAQAHEVPIGHDDMAGTLRWMADRQDGEASPAQRMNRIGYLDLVGGQIRRVLEQGILLLSRSTTWIAPRCERCSRNG